MKTKDLNFIEAYEAFKAGHDVYLQEQHGDPFKADAFFKTGAMLLIDRIVSERFYIKRRPLKDEFTAFVYETEAPIRNKYGTIEAKSLIRFINKKVKIIVEEITDESHS